MGAVVVRCHRGVGVETPVGYLLPACHLSSEGLMTAH